MITITTERWTAQQAWFVLELIEEIYLQLIEHEGIRSMHCQREIDRSNMEEYEAMEAEQPMDLDDDIPW
jgi:hypothetical protein